MAPSPADNSTPMLTVSTYKSGPAVTPGVHSDLNPKREKRKNNFILRRIRKNRFMILLLIIGTVFGLETFHGGSVRDGGVLAPQYFNLASKR